MKWRLGGILEARIAKGLRAEVVVRADLARVVAEQVDIVAIVRFIGRATQHLLGAHRLTGLQRQIPPVAPGTNLAKHQHLLSPQAWSTLIALPW